MIERLYGFKMYTLWQRVPVDTMCQWVVGSVCQLSTSWLSVPMGLSVAVGSVYPWTQWCQWVPAGYVSLCASEFSVPVASVFQWVPVGKSHPKQSASGLSVPVTLQSNNWLGNGTEQLTVWKKNWVLVITSFSSESSWKFFLRASLLVLTSRSSPSIFSKVACKWQKWFYILYILLYIGSGSTSGLSVYMDSLRLPFLCNTLVIPCGKFGLPYLGSAT